MTFSFISQNVCGGGGVAIAPFAQYTSVRPCLDIHILLLLEEVVEHVRVVPDLAAHREGLQRVGHTPRTRRMCNKFYYCVSKKL